MHPLLLPWIPKNSILRLKTPLSVILFWQPVVKFIFHILIDIFCAWRPRVKNHLVLKAGTSEMPGTRTALHHSTLSAHYTSIFTLILCSFSFLLWNLGYFLYLLLNRLLWSTFLDSITEPANTRLYHLNRPVPLVISFDKRTTNLFLERREIRNLVSLFDIYSE